MEVFSIILRRWSLYTVDHVHLRLKITCVKSPSFQGPKSAILTVIHLFENTDFQSLERSLRGDEGIGGGGGGRERERNLEIIILKPGQSQQVFISE